MKKLLFLLILISLFACAKNKQAKGAQPSNPSQATQLNLKDANQLLGQKRCNQAIPLYKKFLDKEARDSGAWNLLGLAYLCNNEPQQAVTAFTRALEISPTFTDVHNNLGVAYTEMRDYTQARNEFLKALQDVNYPPVAPWFNLAKLAFLQQNYEESRALAKKVIEKSPKSAGPQLLYAISLEHLGR
ncbi:MAG TPA: tetratricopeptide repeat protein, partial [Acidobacteriota bacterium]|nr:tetratricopeptide repeat protein [Acidobacteriota bacterium]